MSFQGHEQNLQKEKVMEGAAPEGGALCIGGGGGEERRGKEVLQMMGSFLINFF